MSLLDPSKSGDFSSKSAYLTDQFNRFSNPSPIHSFNWKKLWNAKIHNRHKLLLWRIVNNLLPTKMRLNSIFRTPNLHCHLCNSGQDSSDHLFMRCPFIQQAWFISKWNFRIDFFSNLSVNDWISLILTRNINMFSSQVVCNEFLVFNACLFDLVWFNRNKIAHGSLSLTVQELTKRAMKNANDHWENILLTSTSARSPPNHNWTCPPIGWLKINIDTSFKDGNSHSSCIIRNSNGSIVLAHSSAQKCHDPLTAEALAILEGCKI